MDAERCPGLVAFRSDVLAFVPRPVQCATDGALSDVFCSGRAHGGPARPSQGDALDSIYLSLDRSRYGGGGGSLNSSCFALFCGFRAHVYLLGLLITPR